MQASSLNVLDGLQTEELRQTLINSFPDVPELKDFKDHELRSYLSEIKGELNVQEMKTNSQEGVNEIQEEQEPQFESQEEINEKERTVEEQNDSSVEIIENIHDFFTQRGLVSRAAVAKFLIDLLPQLKEEIETMNDEELLVMHGEAQQELQKVNKMRKVRQEMKIHKEISEKLMRAEEAETRSQEKETKSRTHAQMSQSNPDNTEKLQDEISKKQKPESKIS